MITSYNHLIIVLCYKACHNSKLSTFNSQLSKFISCVGLHVARDISPFDVPNRYHGLR